MTTESTPKDERRGYPSASSAEVDTLCPGRHLAQQEAKRLGVPEVGADDADTLTGISVHDELALSSKDITATPRSEAAEALFQTEQFVLKQWIEEFGITDAVNECREVRGWLRDDKKQPVCSGKVDCIYGGRDTGGNLHILIIDYKSSPWGQHKASGANLQLRDLAVIFWRKTGASHARCAIIQSGKDVETVDYSLLALHNAFFEVLARAKASMQLGAARNPGIKQCRYCRAKTICPEALKEAQLLDNPSVTHIIPTASGPAQIVTLMTPEDKVHAWKRWQLAQGIAKELKKSILTEMESNPESPLFALGLSLKPGANRYTVPEELHAQAVEASMKTMSTEAILRSCSMINVPKMAKYARKHLMAKVIGKNGHENLPSIDDARKYVVTVLLPGLTKNSKSRQSIVIEGVVDVETETIENE